MFRGSGVLSELICPKSGCDRPYCRFFHEGRSEPVGNSNGYLNTPPFPCEPQDYKFAFPSDNGTEECDPVNYSQAQPANPLPSCPYRVPGARPVGDVAGDLNHQNYSISDFGYLPHIPSLPGGASPMEPPFVAFDASMYTGYQAQSSKYAPEEPGVLGSESFSGYAPAPSPSSSTHALFSSAAYSANSTESTGTSNGCEDVVQPSSSVFLSTSVPCTLSNSSTQDSSFKSAQISDGLKHESLADTQTKTSTAKKIKTLPLPKVPPIHATKSKSEQFKEYVGEVARLNEEIERLQKLQEQLRQEAKKIASTAGDIPPSIVQSTQELLEHSVFKAAPEASNKTHYSKREEDHQAIPSRERPVVAEYTPTPLADLERMKKEELKRKKKENGRKHEASKDRVKNEHGRRRPPSEDDLSKLFGDDEVEPKAKRLKDEAPHSSKKTVHRVVTSESSSSRSREMSSEGSLSPETRISKVDKRKSPTISTSSSVDEPVESISDMASGLKKRIAREGASDRPARVVVPPRKVPSAREQLHARMLATAAAKASTSKQTTSKAKPITQEQMYGHHRPNTVGSVAKGESRTARSTTTSALTDIAMPRLRDPANQKIPYATRVMFLKKIFDQYLEVCPRVEAIRNSEIEEKAIVDKVHHAQSYKVAAINLIGRIRNAKSTGAGKHRAALSHDAVLAGRHVNDISVRVRKSSKNTSTSLSEKEFYNLLINKYLMTDEQLTRNGYPRAVPGEDGLVSIAQSHFEISKSQKSWASKDDLERLCSRCHKEFRLDPKGKVVSAECIYHYKGLQRRGGMRGESYFACCGADRTTPGCCVADAHVSDTLNAEALREFTPTPASRGEADPRNCKVYAMDCEMVYGVWGPELARVSVVDMDNKLVLDLIVKPHNTIIDYNTRFSGLTANQVETSNVDLFEAQNRLFELVNERSILIGHSLESDLKAMRIRHERVVDTAVVFEHRQGFPFKRALRNLASEYLQKIIQEDDSGHDSQEDSATCMSLMLMKVKEDCK